MTSLCEGRRVVVTGAGRGIGREHALEFARQGADVVVNDLGTEVDGSGTSLGPVVSVARQIRDLGRRAIVSSVDVSDEAGAEQLIQTAIEEFGGLDVVVNNAGILRDRMLTNMSMAEWDDVIRVHLRGTFGPSHFAAKHWRELAKAGAKNEARIINTSSPSGLYGNVGQTNYGAAKAGIASFTVIAAMELAPYGVTVNAIAPVAATRMTVPSGAGKGASKKPPSGFDSSDPSNISPLVAWLGSRESGGVTGRIFNVRGGHISMAESWRRGPAIDRDRRWNPTELGEVIPGLVAKSQPNSNMLGVPAAAELFGR